MNRGAQHWGLQVPGWLLFAYLVYAQAIPAFDYQLGVRMGTQESARQITDAGAAAVGARDANGWDIDETACWIVLPVIAAWALWGLVHVARSKHDGVEKSR